MKNSRNYLRVITLIYCIYMWLFATHFHFMALNVLLAYIPIELSYLLNAEKRKRDWLIGFAWLIFYPNAPYLFTDFFHLETLSIYRGFNTIFANQIGDWWAFVCLTSGIVIYGLLGMKNAGLLSFTVQAEPQNGVVNGSSIVPALGNFDNPAIILAVIGLVLTTILVVTNVRGAILIGIVVTTLVAIPMGVVDTASVDWHANSLGNSFKELGTTFGAAFGAEGLQSLFSDSSKIPQVLMTIIAFSLSDTFDTIGTFIGTGRRTGIFSKEDELALEDSKGFSTKMDKALFADAIATSIGAIFGTSNTTTYVESAAGIGAGGRTGLTSVVVAILFALSSLFSPLIAIVPAQATAPALILVGIMMLASFKDINWTDLEDAIPAFFASIFMGLCYSISYGIAAGFIFYAVVKVVKGKAKEVSPIIWIIDALFILNFVILAIL